MVTTQRRSYPTHFTFTLQHISESQKEEVYDYTWECDNDDFNLEVPKEVVWDQKAPFIMSEVADRLSSLALPRSRSLVSNYAAPIKMCLPPSLQLCSWVEFASLSASVSLFLLTCMI